MIQMYNVTMKYPGGEGLEGVNLTINNGEFVFLVGPTGAGKSTLLKLIYMEEFPDTGQVVVDGFNSLYMTTKDIPYLRRKIGVVFQDFKLLKDRNVFENVAFALRVTGARKRQLKKKVLQGLAEMGLSHKRNKMPHELSGGEQQRVAIARALINEPSILLADEPTGNLDAEAAKDILDLLGKINSRGTAILMATHNYEMVKNLGHRIVKIEKGRIL